MRALGGLARALAGFAAGLAVAVLIAACCPTTKTVVWDVLPGTYHIDNRLLILAGQDAPSIDPLQGDTDYQLVVSGDGTQATETFQRNGATYQTVYALGPGTETSLRSDTNLFNEQLGQ